MAQFISEWLLTLSWIWILYKYVASGLLFKKARFVLHFRLFLWFISNSRTDIHTKWLDESLCSSGCCTDSSIGTARLVNSKYTNSSLYSQFFQQVFLSCKKYYSHNLSKIHYVCYKITKYFTLFIFLNTFIFIFT